MQQTSNVEDNDSLVEWLLLNWQKKKKKEKGAHYINMDSNYDNRVGV